MQNYSYNKELKRFEFFDQRFYTDDDGETYFPSVTHVLGCFPKDPHILKWMKDMGRNADIIMKEAGDEGTKVHNLIDAFLKNPGVDFSLVDHEGEPMYNEREWKMALRAMEFFDTVRPEVIATEQNIVSRSYRIGGTLDLGARFRGKTSITDYKTSNGIYITHWIQQAVYAKLWNELYPDDQIDTCHILWLKADTKGPSNTGKPSEPTIRKLPIPKEPTFKKRPNPKKAPIIKKTETTTAFQERVGEYEQAETERMNDWLEDCEERKYACEHEYNEKMREYHASAKERNIEYHEKLKEWNDTKPIQGYGWQLKEMTWKMPDGEDDITGPEAIDRYFKLYKCCRFMWDYLNPNYKPFNKRFPDSIKYTP